MSKGTSKPDVLQGTLDLMVLRTLETMGPQHGFGLAKRIQQISAGVLDLNQGTLYPALLRLESARLDFFPLGRLRQESPRQVLRADQSRPETDRPRN
jgi:hypothetical protein